MGFMYLEKRMCMEEGGGNLMDEKIEVWTFPFKNIC